MFDIQNYGSFIMAVVLFQLIPGAGTIAILSATAQGGVSTGMRAVVGTLTGDFIYMLSAILGLAALLSAYPGILTIAQWAGVTYLFWIGLNFLRLSFTDKSVRVKPNNTNWTHFRQALAISLTNPKAVMFFMAFFPFFLSKESKPLTLVALIVHVTIISFLYQTGLVFVGNTVVRRISQLRFAPKLTTRLFGLAFIGFGIRLILNKGR